MLSSIYIHGLVEMQLQVYRLAYRVYIIISQNRTRFYYLEI